MATASPTRDPAAAPRSSGSAAAPPEQHVCETCGRTFAHKIGLWNHQKSHDRAAQDPAAADVKVRRSTKVSQKELAELQDDLGENIRTVAALLHAPLTALKLLKLENPDARLRIPRTSIELPLPSVDTHLPYVLKSRSDITARVLIEHAAENETLLRWIVRFNGWFRGGEVGQLVAAHAAGVALSAGAGGPLIGVAVRLAQIDDVLEVVEQENARLRQQVATLQAQLQVVRPPDDERGTGS
jgi:hypothetical protein